MDRSSVAGKAGAVQRLPPAPSPVGRARPVQQATPGAVLKAKEPEKLAAELQDGSILKRRKYIVRAVGIAVLAVAFTFVGARLKELKQDRDRMNAIEAAARELAGDAYDTKETIPQIAPVASAQKEQAEKQTNTPAVETSAPADRARGSPYSIGVARQIALLEDRKAALNRQKMTFEAKIQMLRERQARKAEMNAGRPTQGNG